MEATIEISGLLKRFDATVALAGMGLTVARPGGVDGLAGPGGADKSAAIRVIPGLDAADAGGALTCGRPYAILGHPLSHVGSLEASARQAGRSGRGRLPRLAHGEGLNARRAGGPPPPKVPS
jgi:ABC-type branched-subunit amino acid transport system ATPase component